MPRFHAIVNKLLYPVLFERMLLMLIQVLVMKCYVMLGSKRKLYLMKCPVDFLHFSESLSINPRECTPAFQLELKLHAS